jgi:hypothetical protein
VRKFNRLVRDLQLHNVDVRSLIPPPNPAAS